MPEFEIASEREDHTDPTAVWSKGVHPDPVIVHQFFVAAQSFVVSLQHSSVGLSTFLSGLLCFGVKYRPIYMQN
jgi:hypothetical protein